MLAWCLNAIYLTVLMLASPLLVYRRFVQKKPVAGLGDKLSGRITRQHPDRPCVWFHAVSVGEVLQLPTLIADFVATHPQHEILITTTTGTGFDVAKQKFPQHTIGYWPFDFTWAVTQALKTVRPEMVVLVELELWPNFLLAAKSMQIPVVLINGRISANSFRGYGRLTALWKRVLPALTRCAVQTEEYADRLIALGVPSNRVTVTGNIKFDRVQSNRRNPKTDELRRFFGIADNEHVFIAGSTQETEEAAAITTWEALRAEFPQLRLILVPRHKERFEDVARLVISRGHELVRRSGELRVESEEKGKDASSLSQLSTLHSQPILLLDTLGELGACWGLADVAFVGGSLTNRGGQNMLEPAAYGAAVLFGPNTRNFKDIVEQLLSRNAARVVQNGDELTITVGQLLRDQQERCRMGKAAREFVQSQQGATAKTLAVIAEITPLTLRAAA
jgi:3-deoxy-D-manno-octulosonic-acid transferase